MNGVWRACVRAEIGKGDGVRPSHPGLAHTLLCVLRGLTAGLDVEGGSLVLSELPSAVLASALSALSFSISADHLGHVWVRSLHRRGCG